MEMKKYILVVCLLCFTLSAKLFAQNNHPYLGGDNNSTATAPANEQEGETTKKGFDKSKLRIGGALGATFGNYTYIQVAPVVGYRFFKWFEPGIGVAYQYQNYRGDAYNNPFTAHVYGGNAYVRIYPWRNLFAQGQAVLYNFNQKEKVGTQTYKASVTYGNVLVGAGYNFEVGNNTFVSVQLMVNLIENALYPTRRPFLDFGFSFGL